MTKVSNQQFRSITDNYSRAVEAHRHDTIAFWDEDYLEYRFESEIAFEFAEAMFDDALENFGSYK